MWNLTELVITVAAAAISSLVWAWILFKVAQMFCAAIRSQMRGGN
jgi:hypothetical protein